MGVYIRQCNCEFSSNITVELIVLLLYIRKEHAFILRCKDLLYLYFILTVAPLSQCGTEQMVMRVTPPHHRREP